jgi:signal peptidase II
VSRWSAGEPLAFTARWYALAALVVVLDQLSKQAASRLLEYARPQEIFGWFNLTLHHNQGAAFSFLSGAGGWQRWFFALLAVIISGALLLWLRGLGRAQWLLALGLALILGGALGNLIDRLWLGYVVDFISVHYRDWYFPTFNVADSAISVGAALVVLDSLRGEGEAERHQQ